MRVVVFGCGSIGRRYVAWSAEMGHEVAGCDRDDGQRQWIADNLHVPAFSTLEEVLAWKPDLVIVSTPPDHHESVACAAMDAGIEVLIEKPIAHDLVSAKRIGEAAKRAKAPAWVVCNMRFHVGVQAIRNNLAMIGKPLCFRGVFGQRLSQMRLVGGDFARATGTGGGIVLDCIHEFDYLRWMFGPFAKVTGAAAQIGEEPMSAEDYAAVLITFASNVRGSLHLDFLMRQKRRGLEVVGTEGSLFWLSTGNKPEIAKVIFASRTEEKVLLDDPDVDQRHEYDELLKRFFNRTGDLQTVDEAIQALDAALSARKSA